MLKDYRKFIAVFALLSLLMVVGGFCYVPEAKASTSSSHLVSDDLQDCNQETQDKIYSKDKVPLPLSKNSVKPCCIDRHDKMPVTSVSNFSGTTEIALVVDQIIESKEIYQIKNVSNLSSNTSPPKPDKLSSILRLE